MIRSLFLACALPGMAVAQTVLSPEQFDADVSGKTVYFRFPDGDFAAEQYFENRDVLWLVAGEDCKEGRWEPRGEQICFTYDVEPGEWHCWNYIGDGDGRYAHRLIEDAREPYDIEILRVVDTPLRCPGPAVGVSYTPARR